MVPNDRLDAVATFATIGTSAGCVESRGGVDRRGNEAAVPVCFAVDRNEVGVAIDTVKAKTSSRLRRERNLDEDPRATLLVEHWDPVDWSQLWWVRVSLRWEPVTADRAATLSGLLADRYPQYRDQPFTRVLVLRIVGVSGWAASAT